MIEDTNLLRLNLFLARCGVASRRASDGLISAGRVSVNGKIVKELGIKVNPASDMVLVDGKTVTIPHEELVYFMVNKPKGYASTVDDPHAKKVVTELVPRSTRLYPVGRLDEDSEGLIFLTNDGDFAYTLTHPKYHIPKTYHVLVRGKISSQSLQELRTGIEIDDEITAPCQVRVLDTISGESLLEFTLYEGRKRQIRKMCAAINFFVVKLTRVSVGDVVLGDLAVGKYRALSKSEVDSLKHYND